MDKEELMEKYAHNVEWLRRNVPPDDIYNFTEQTVMAAMYFLKEWTDWEDIIEIQKKDPIARKWIRNILGMVAMRDAGLDCDIDLNLDIPNKDDDEIL